ncbi:MAG: hypothetical protein KDC28_03555 [Saprospiraceae bacterium]|nr:hypothetical protein [Saprospiraceae bacterium]MCB9319342.1 hypothetical protein [Lewinellaceae bacterium]
MEDPITPVSTRQFHIDQKQYMKLLLIQKYRKSTWWLWPLLLLIVINMVSGFARVGIVLLMGLIFYLIYIYQEYRHYVQSRKNQALFAPQSFEFYPQSLFQTTQLGKVEVPYTSITRIEKRSDHIKLHLTDKTWFFIPAGAIKRKEDLLKILEYIE